MTSTVSLTLNLATHIEFLHDPLAHHLLLPFTSYSSPMRVRTIGNTSIYRRVHASRWGRTRPPVSGALRTPLIPWKKDSGRRSYLPGSRRRRMDELAPPTTRRFVSERLVSLYLGKHTDHDMMRGVSLYWFVVARRTASNQRFASSTLFTFPLDLPHSYYSRHTRLNDLYPRSSRLKTLYPLLY